MKKLYTLFLLLALSVISFAQSNVVSDATELAALKALWESTDGAHWTNNTNWPTAGSWPSTASAATMDTWYGIGVTNGDITSIIVNNNNLVGTLPTQLGNLTQVDRYNFNDNKLYGTLPTQLGSLTKLKYLIINNNQFTGSIPSELSTCTELLAFYLGTNKLTGSIPSSLSALTKLNYFDVSANQLSGTVPNIFTGMTALVGLYLNSNKFTGTLPTLRGSTTIDVSNNQFTGAFPTVNGSAIATILASNNWFSSISSFSVNPSLKLDFTNNELTTLPTITANTNLQVLFTNNRLDFSKLETFASGYKSNSLVVPQKYINDEPTKVMTSGSALVISARTRGSHTTTVTWEKLDATGTWTAVSNDQDTVKRTYTRTSAAQGDEGSYRWKETSTSFSGVTLQSDPIVVKSAMRFTMDNWGFQYRYDNRRRMTHKKVPGADWVYMVYDKRDRVVMTQDGVQRSSRQWTFTKYDTLNRPVMTGLYTHSSIIDQPTMSGLISTSRFAEWFDGTSTALQYSHHVLNSTSLNGTFEPLTVTYYDNYDFLHGDLYLKYRVALTGQYDYGSATSFPRVAGLVTGVWTRVLGKDKQWLRTVNYYDDKGRVVQTITDNHKRGLDVVTNKYDFTGRVLTSKTESIDHHLSWGVLHSSSWVTEDRILTTAASSSFPYAFSSQQIALNTDGWIEFTCSSDMSFTSNRTFGFSSSNTGGNNVLYGVKQAVASGASTVQVTENGTLKGSAITNYGGDVIRIERTGSTMNYSRNGVVFYSTTGLSTRPAVYAHMILNYPNSALFNPRISTAGTTKSVERDFVYDHAGRVLEVWHAIDGADSLLLTKNEYNELGQLVDKKIHSTDTTNFRQSLDYRYNIRGWLTSINGAELGSGNDKNEDTSHDRRDLFGMDLLYNNTISGIGNTSMYNGNISAMRWSTNLGLASTKERGYKFEYDPMNRLTAANQKTYNTTWASSTANKEADITYDLNGNIKTLKRTDESGASMDDLTYNYGSSQTASNVLQKVNDAGTASGFSDAASQDNDYTYDNNGNLITDKNKSITSITYNHLNLPDKVTKSTNEYLIYTYDATGRKLAQDLYTAANVLKKRSDYRGEWFYENDTLRFLNHEEGRALPDGSWVAATQLFTDPDMTNAANFGAYGGTNITTSIVTVGSETYLKVVRNQSTSTPGFLSPFVTVVPGRQYTLRVKGYNNGSSSTPAISLMVTGTGLTAVDPVWPGPDLPYGSGGEGWVEVTFTVASTVNKIRCGALWRAASATGQEFYVSRMELYEYNGIHGNTTFSQSGYEYQYHLKDHLGNVRMTFTTKDEVESMRATLETDSISKDRSNYLRYDLARRVKSSLFDHTRDNLTDTIGYATRLNGSANEKIGLAKSFSVMPGDTIRAEVYAKYVDPDDGNWLSILTTLMGYVANPGGAPSGTVIDGTGYSGSGATSIGITPIGHSSDTESAVPKAYLNYIFINKNFDLASVETWYERIDGGLEDGSDGPHDVLTIERAVKEPGYVYVYLSNDGAMEVYFDDFKVEHVKSPVLSSQDYFPFGLAFGNYQRENSVDNQYRYNGKEQQNELSLGWFDFHARQYDPTIGRFVSVDPATEVMRRHSPYNFAFDNPLRFMDPDGMKPKDGITVERKRYDKDGNELARISFRRAQRIETKVTVHNAKVLNNSNSDPASDREATKDEVKEAGESMAKEIVDSWSGTSTNKKGQTVTTSVEFTGEITVIDNAKQAKGSDFVMEIKNDGEVTNFAYALGGARRGGNKIDVGYSSSYLRDIKERNDSGGSGPISLVPFGQTRVAGHEFGHSGTLHDNILGGMMSPDTYRPTFKERKNFFRGR